MKIICVGRNYTDHIKELENQRPKSPVLFHKPDSSIILKNRPFFIPDFSNEIQWFSIDIYRFLFEIFDFRMKSIGFSSKSIDFQLKLIDFAQS